MKEFLKAQRRGGGVAMGGRTWETLGNLDITIVTHSFTQSTDIPDIPKAIY